MLLQSKFLQPFYSTFHGHDFVMDAFAKFMVRYQVSVTLQRIP
jgi:hypothetical protein